MTKIEKKISDRIGTTENVFNIELTALESLGVVKAIIKSRKYDDTLKSIIIYQFLDDLISIDALEL